MNASQGCRRPKRRKRSLIRKVRPIANDPEITVCTKPTSSPSVLDRRCVAEIAKCLRLTAVVGRDANMVNEVLKQRRFDAVVLAAGADDQCGGIEQRKGLRGHEDPVVGRSVPGKIDDGIGARWIAGDRVAAAREAVIPRAGGVSSTPRLLGLITTASGILDRPPSRTMTTEYDFAISRRIPPEVCWITSRPLCQRAQGRPGACCTRGPACDLRKQNCTRAYRAARNTPAFPAQWLYGLLRALPGERLFCLRRRRDTSHQLSASTATPEPHDFAVHVRRVRLSRPQRPPHLTARS